MHFLLCTFYENDLLQIVLEVYTLFQHNAMRENNTLACTLLYKLC